MMAKVAEEIVSEPTETKRAESILAVRSLVRNFVPVFAESRCRIAELAVFGHVAMGAQSHKVPQSVITLLTPSHLVVDLQILERAAASTPPPVPLQYPLY
jgi:hypothetical protein